MLTYGPRTLCLLIPSRGENCLETLWRESLWKPETKRKPCREHLGGLTGGMWDSNSFVLPHHSPEGVQTRRSPAGLKTSHPFVGPFTTTDLDVTTTKETNQIRTRSLPQHDSDQIPVGGRLAHFFPAWSASNANSWTLEIVSQGYAIEFLHTPPYRFVSSPLSSNSTKRDRTLKS